MDCYAQSEVTPCAPLCAPPQPLPPGTSLGVANTAEWLGHPAQTSRAGRPCYPVA